MRVIVCGGRDYGNYTLMWDVLNELCPPESNAVIVHGGARGADYMAGMVAKSLGLDVEPHPADWKRYGRAAGPIRNQEMLNSGADIVVAFPGGKGTNDMIERAIAAGVRVRKIVDCGAG